MNGPLGTFCPEGSINWEAIVGDQMSRDHMQLAPALHTRYLIFLPNYYIYFSYKKDAVVYRYSEWSKYSSCTKSCGNGVRIRTREFLGDVCMGPATETKPCKKSACPSKWLFCNFMFINFMCQAEKI